MEDRVIMPDESTDDAALDLTLRPQSFAEYVGQTKVKESLTIAIEATKRRKESLEHVLLHGAPGLGKTTLAHIIARELGSSIRVTSGPALERAGDLAAILTNLRPGDILFIDEMHRLPKTIEEVLYPAMEDYALDLVLGKGPSARTVRLDLPKFTLVAATTRVSLLSSPMRDRFGHVFHLDHYSTEEIGAVLARAARILGVALADDARMLIASRARATPRIANRLLKRVRDYTEVKGDGTVQRAIAEEALQQLEVDALGLDAIDRRILTTIAEKFGGGPVGLTTIAAATGEEAATVEEVYEPFLLQLGFLERTARGRMVTARAYTHLGLAPQTAARNIQLPISNVQ
ncbi:MAG: Holliday junction branch migration DNA helicase RuvB [Candidatus Uhrbacteria bacterium]